MSLANFNKMYIIIGTIIIVVIIGITIFLVSNLSKHDTKPGKDIVPNQRQTTFIPKTTQQPTTQPPSTQQPSTQQPTTQPPTTQPPTTQPPSTQQPSTQPPSTQQPTTQPPSTQPPTTFMPTTFMPTTFMPTTFMPTTYPIVSENYIKEKLSNMFNDELKHIFIYKSLSSTPPPHTTTPSGTPTPGGRSYSLEEQAYYKKIYDIFNLDNKISDSSLIGAKAIINILIQNTGTINDTIINTYLSSQEFLKYFSQLLSNLLSNSFSENLLKYVDDNVAMTTYNIFVNKSTDLLFGFLYKEDNLRPIDNLAEFKKQLMGKNRQTVNEFLIPIIPILSQFIVTNMGTFSSFSFDILNKPLIFISNLMVQLKNYCSQLECNNVNFDIEQIIQNIEDNSRTDVKTYIDNNEFIVQENKEPIKNLISEIKTKK